MITMILPVAFKLIAAYCLLFLSLSITVAAAVHELPSPPPSVALPSCTAACGNLTVPYPFGIGSGCFLDELYEIECHRGGESAPVATLKNRMNVTVLNISLPVPDNSGGPGGFIEVSQPVLYADTISEWNYMGGAVNGDITQSLNLTGSPYMYSQTKNLFVFGGCNNLAFMVNLSKKLAIVGCRSTCPETGTYYDCGNGIGCCMNTIPFGLQAYDVDFQKEDDTVTSFYRATVPSCC